MYGGPSHRDVTRPMVPDGDVPSEAMSPGTVTGKMAQSGMVRAEARTRKGFRDRDCDRDRDRYRDRDCASGPAALPREELPTHATPAARAGRSWSLATKFSPESGRRASRADARSANPMGVSVRVLTAFRCVCGPCPGPRLDTGGKAAGWPLGSRGGMEATEVGRKSEFEGPGCPYGDRTKPDYIVCVRR